MLDVYTLDVPISVTDEEITAGRTSSRIPMTKISQGKFPPSEVNWMIEYLRNGFKAYRAGITVGFGESKALLTSGWIRQTRELSSKPWLWDVMMKSQRRHLSHLDATRERVMLEYSRIAFFDPQTMYDAETKQLLHISDMPEDTRRAIAGMDVTTTQQAERVTKIKLSQKNNALKDLSLILGITKETVVHEHKFADLLKEIQQDSPNDPLVVNDPLTIEVIPDA